MATVTIIVEDRPTGIDLDIHMKSDGDPDAPPTTAEQAAMFMLSMVGMLAEDTQVTQLGQPEGGIEL